MAEHTRNTIDKCNFPGILHNELSKVSNLVRLYLYKFSIESPSLIHKYQTD